MGFFVFGPSFKVIFYKVLSLARLAVKINLKAHVPQADFVTFAQNEMKAGKTVDQATPDYKLPAKFKGYQVTVNEEFASVKTNLQKVYDELKK